MITLALEGAVSDLRGLLGRAGMGSVVLTLKFSGVHA